MYQYINHYEIGHKAERYEHIEKTISMYRYINHYQIVASKEEGHPGVCVCVGGGGVTEPCLCYKSSQYSFADA